jgi:methionyl-tRNA formyltransferase
MKEPEIKIDGNNVTISLPKDSFEGMTKMECFMNGCAETVKRLKPIVENGRLAKDQNSFPRWGYTYEALLSSLESFVSEYQLEEGPGKKNRIIFFGSGDFPLQTLKRLIEEKYDIVGVVTSHDKLMFDDNTSSHIKDIAFEHNIPFIIPKSMNDPYFLDWLDEHPAEIYCVISYKYLPAEVISRAGKMAFNVHASLLPYLRGAAPINWAIANGFTETGLTAFELNEKIDNGDILMNCKCTIEEEDTYGSLFMKLAEMCPEFTVNVINSIINDEFRHPVKQPTGAPVHSIDRIFYEAPKLNDKITTFCGVHVGSQIIHDMVRSMNPGPGLTLCVEVLDDNHLTVKADEFDGRPEVVKRMKFKVYETELEYIESDMPIPDYEALKLYTDFKTKMYFYGTNRSTLAVVLKRVQIPGKKILPIEEFLRGLAYLNKPGYELRIVPPEE